MIELSLGQSVDVLDGHTVLPVDPSQSQMLMIKNPASARILIGDGKIEVASEEPNSGILVTTRTSGTNALISAVSADSGSHLLRREAAKEVAEEWCDLASRSVTFESKSPGYVAEFKDEDEIICQGISPQGYLFSARVVESKNMPGNKIRYRAVLYYGEASD